MESVAQVRKEARTRSRDTEAQNAEGMSDEEEQDINAIMGSFRGEIASMLDRHTGSITRHLQREVGKVNTRCDAMASQVSCHESKLRQAAAERAELEKKYKEIDDRTCKLEKLAAAPAPSPSAPPPGKRQLDPHFVDTSILRINAQQLVGKQEIQKVMEKLASEAGLAKDTFTVRGADLGRRYVVAFSGDPATAMRRARKTNDTMRSDDNVWQPQSVPTPAGASEPIYISLDKSAATIKKEKLLKVLWDELARSDLQKIRRESAISWQWKVCATVVFDDATGDARVEWDHNIAKEAGISTEEADKAIASTRAVRQRG